MNRIRKTWDYAAAGVMGGDDRKAMGLTGKEMEESLQRSNRGWREACTEEQRDVVPVW